jgi:hypothetical protein
LEENAANLGNVLRPKVKYVFQCINFFRNKNCSTGLRGDLGITSEAWTHDGGERTSDP